LWQRLRVEAGLCPCAPAPPAAQHCRQRGCKGLKRRVRRTASGPSLSCALCRQTWRVAGSACHPCLLQRASLAACGVQSRHVRGAPGCVLTSLRARLHYARRCRDLPRPPLRPAQGRADPAPSCAGMHGARYQAPAAVRRGLRDPGATPHAVWRRRRRRLPEPGGPAGALMPSMTPGW